MNFVLIQVINLIFEFFSIIILIDVLASWVMVLNVRLPDAIFRLLEVVHNVAGVVLNPIRRVMPSMGGLDLSPFIALLLMGFIQQLLVRLIRGY